MSNSEQLVRDYYAAFNAGDMDAFLALLAEDGWTVEPVTTGQP